MSDNKKSYYAVIPATVRYDRKLKANAKLLYGEITALCNEKGYCWASNSYFAKLYEVSNQAVSAWIKALQNSGYVNIEYERKGQHITKRKVSINIDRVSTEVDGGINKSLRGYQQNFKENTTVNNTSNNTYIYSQVIDYLNEKVHTKYKHTTKKNQELIKARLNEGFTLDNFKTVIDKKHKEWRGTEFEKYLRPYTLFGTKFESYLNQKTGSKMKADINNHSANLEGVDEL